MKSYLNVDQVSGLLTISKPTLYRWMKEGIIPFIKINRRLFFDPDQVELSIQQHTVGVK